MKLQSFIKISICLLLLFVFFVPQVFAAGFQVGPVIKTKNITALIVKCRMVTVDKTDKFGFLRTWTQEYSPTRIYSAYEDPSYVIVLLIQRLVNDVPVKWTVIWEDDKSGYAEGLEYNGIIKTSVAPGGPAAIFSTKVKGEEMTVFPLLAQPTSKAGRTKGKHRALIHSFEVDGKTIDFSCSASYEIR